MKLTKKFDLGSLVIAILIALSMSVMSISIGGCESGDSGTDAVDAVNQADCLTKIQLTDQHNHPVILSSLKGKLVLFNFIYTSCPGPCLTETLKIAKLADRLGSKLGKQVVLVSVTVDPEHDGPAELLKYAQKQDVDRAGWLFLTGSPAAVDETLKNFKLVRQRDEDGSVDHVIGVFLVGPDGRELREYNGEILKADGVIADINHALAKG
jgi:cytochrome oxidase Cu insertion factor (SCO1/SenC/PrrC family)